MSIVLPILLVAGIGLVAGFGLAMASKYLSEPVDELKEKIREALPGANCGGCGFAGCDEYAAAIREGKAEAGLCAPGGKNTAVALSEILGVDVSAQEKRAYVTCNGDCYRAKTKFAYSGLNSCAAAMYYRGPMKCEFGCIGLGDCAAVCDRGAIRVNDGLARVDRELCGGCGKCVTTCPKGVIKLLPESYHNVVACQSTEKGSTVIKQCDIGCIGCMKCVKECKHDAIHVENFLAVIDQSKCTGCDECALVCPRGIIHK